jgi:hypothetical protein
MAKLKDLGWLDPNEDEVVVVGTVQSSLLPKSMSKEAVSKKVDEDESGI